MIKNKNMIKMTLKTILIAVFALLAFTQTADAAVSCPFQPQANRTIVSFNTSLVWGKSVTESFKNVNLPSGTYKVSAFSYDSYEDRVGISQANERFFVEFRNGSTVITRSAVSQDLQDRVRTATWSGILNSNLVVSQNTTVLGVRHANYLGGGSGSDSVTAGCIALDLITPPQNDLTASCSVNPNSVAVNGTLNWTVNTTGGNGNLTYLWSGTDGLSANTKDVSKSYSSAGTKTGTVTVTSGSQTVTQTCTGTVTQQTTDAFSVSCSVDDSNVEVDEEVRFTANATGGTSSYSYNWDGSEGLDGNSRSIDWSFDNDGTKNATVTVTSGNQTASASCTVRVEEEEEDLEVSCYANPTNPRVGQQVRWYADVDGGEGDYDYDWTGDEDLDSSSRSPSITYYESGVYDARVRVTDEDGNTETDTCRVTVGNNNVLAFSQPQGEVLGAVYLNQVPYTGLAEDLAVFWFVIGLALFSAYMTYVVMAYKKENA